MLLTSAERNFFEAVYQVSYANPFTEALGEGERRALGAEYTDAPAVWSLDVRDPLRQRENSWRVA